MIRLQTLGGAALYGDGGEVLLGAASQRRTLGLLSILAAAGEGGFSRDKLVGILWPQSSPKRARHSLTQALYAARKAVDCDDLFAASEDVRLNGARIETDVGEFAAALAAGDDVTAAALYCGPFLDGFYLASSEFDWWLHNQRTRLEAAMVGALQRLATAAEAAEDWEAAAGCLRRLAAIRLSDSAVAVRLMQALAAGGDRAEALRHAQEHARLLREQYELEPEPAVVALAAELWEGRRASSEPLPTPGEAARAAAPGVGPALVPGRSAEGESSGVLAAPPPPAERSPFAPGRELFADAVDAAAIAPAPGEVVVGSVEASAPPARRNGTHAPAGAANGVVAAANGVAPAAEPAVGAAEPAQPAVGPGEPVLAGTMAASVTPAQWAAPTPEPRLRALGRALRRHWLVVAVAAVAVAVVAIGGTLLLGRRAAPSASYPALDQRIMVAPFRVAGAGVALDYLREGIVELLSARLADDTAARAVDAGAVLAAWRRAGIARAPDASRDTMVRLARLLGAERLIVGSVVGTPARAIISASVVAVRSGQTEGEATVEGPVDSLTALVDQLAGKLLLVEAGQGDRLAEQMTASLPALRSYLAGASAETRGDFALAARRYAVALRADSAFALAAFRLALVADRLNDFELEREALDRAWPGRVALTERDRAHLVALAGPDYPEVSSAAQSLAAWDEAARQAPNRADVWYGLALRMATDGDQAGLDDVGDRAVAALQRALALDPNHAPARLLLARITNRYDRILPPDATAGGRHAPALASTPFLRWRDGAQRGDAGLLRRLWDSLGSSGPTNLRQVAAASLADGVRLDDGGHALRLLLARAADSEQALDLLLAEHSLALNLGRPMDALEITRQIQRTSPATRVHLRLQVLDAVFGQGDTAAAAAAAVDLARTARSAGLPNAGADACALAQWQLARADTAGARQMLELLRADSAEAPAPVSTPAALCVQLVEAALAVALRHKDARARVERLDSLVLSAPAAGDAAAYAPLVIARLYRRLGMPERALAALRRRPYLSAVWPRYLATELREEGDLARHTDDAAGALTAYRRYLALRTRPEPTAQPALDSVRAQVAALEQAAAGASAHR